MHQPHFRVAEHLEVPNSQCLNPALLSTCERYEEAQFHEFRLSKMFMELCPEFVVCDSSIPEYGARVAEGGLLPVVVTI